MLWLQGLKPGAQRVADNAVPATQRFNEEQLKPGAEQAGEGLKSGADRASKGLQDAADQVAQQAGACSFCGCIPFVCQTTLTAIDTLAELNQHKHACSMCTETWSGLLIWWRQH